jgi:hypothetical protein
LLVADCSLLPSLLGSTSMVQEDRSPMDWPDGETGSSFVHTGRVTALAGVAAARGRWCPAHGSSASVCSIYPYVLNPPYGPAS